MGFIKSLTDFFKSINYTDPVLVSVNKEALFTQLGLHKSKHNDFRMDRMSHSRVMERLNMNPDHHNGDCYSFYAPPGRMTSACVSYTRETYHAMIPNTDIITIIICDDLNNVKNNQSSLLVGITGTHDVRMQDMQILKLYCPVIHQDGTISEPIDTWAITPENVKMTLRYAELCAKTLYAGKVLSPLDCLKQAQKEMSKEERSPRPSEKAPSL
ncbi:MAG: hypothetical protein CO093_07485 [Alphaproteobacteria bacterium CG_4_9_14_3_um_filter_47_13]|nr:MAG: hypothetical protein CO093_07485 [Alphaproteobacteria bacterium CG_4_9_14_3_um_filter_47_13]